MLILDRRPAWPSPSFCDRNFDQIFSLIPNELPGNDEPDDDWELSDPDEDELFQDDEPESWLDEEPDDEPLPNDFGTDEDDDA